jgi:lipopolysaccharide assembly outer membrane protein LptD (OstA)
LLEPFLPAALASPSGTRASFDASSWADAAVTLTLPVVDKAPMLVRADEIKYRYLTRSVSADYRVQINCGGAPLEADKIVYRERNKRRQPRVTR